jgi:uncharacterized protein YbjT (DUF2867 family)
MRILLIGGTGKVGSSAARRLRADGHDAVVAARNLGPGGVTVDLREPDTIEEAGQGYDAVFLVTPLGPDEAEVGVAAVQALRRAGVPKVVYLAIMNLRMMRAIPHFETKIPIKEVVLSESTGVVVEPNFFMANDAMVLPAILGAGVYPLPIGSTGVWSVATDDMGAAVANALTRDDWNGKAVPICGPERLTGEQLAANWSEVLGRPVHYAGDDIAPFVEQVARMVPDFDDWARRDFRLMMEVTQELGCPATPEQQAASRAVIGAEPTRHVDFARALLASQQEKV